MDGDWVASSSAEACPRTRVTGPSVSPLTRVATLKEGESESSRSVDPRGPCVRIVMYGTTNHKTRPCMCAAGIAVPIVWAYDQDGPSPALLEVTCLFDLVRPSKRF